MSIDIKNLESLAKSASTGPWWIDSHGHAMVDAEHRVVFTHDDRKNPAVRHAATGNLTHWRNDVDASFIAAANPATVIELIERLRTAEQERDELRNQLNMAIEFHKKLLVWYAQLTYCDSVQDDGEHVGYCCPMKMMDDMESILASANFGPAQNIERLFADLRQIVSDGSCK